MFLESADLVRLGAWALFTGVTTAMVDNVFVAIQAIPRQTLTQFSLLRSHHNGHQGHKGFWKGMPFVSMLSFVVNATGLKTSEECSTDAQYRG
jgi:hypothetical protein